MMEIPAWLDAENAGRQDEIARREMVEAELIGRMLNSEITEPLNQCSRSDFANNFFGQVFDVVNGLVAAQGAITPASVLAKIQSTGDELKTAAQLIRDVARAFDTSLSKPSDLARVVGENGAKSRAYEELMSLALEALNPDAGLHEIASKAAGIGENIRDRDTTADLVTFNEVALNIAEDLASENTAISTGLPSLDEALGGGFWLGKLYGIQGRMKYGKSLLVGTCAWNIAKAGAPVVYVALEMGQEQIAQRMIASQMGVNAIRFLDRSDRAATDRLATHIGNIADSARVPLYFVDRPQMKFPALQETLHRHVRKAGVKVCIVDYWQLIRGKQLRESNTEFLDGVAQWLADFADAHNVAVVCPAQENRDGECRFGDGLRMASSMYLRIQKPEHETGVSRRWLEMLDSRYTMQQDVGGEHQAPLWIDGKSGPVFRDDAA